MASEFLKKKAAERRASDGGQRGSMPNKSISTNDSKASAFLQKKASDAAERIDKEFGDGAYGGSAWRSYKRDTIGKVQLHKPKTAEELKSDADRAKAKSNALTATEQYKQMLLRDPVAAGAMFSYNKQQSAAQKASRDYNTLMTEYYELENKAQRSKLDADSAASELYRTAQAAGDDRDILRQVRVGQWGDTTGSTDTAYLEYLRKMQAQDEAYLQGKYGTDDYQVIDSQTRLREDEAAQALGDMGYNYDRMSDYERRQQQAQQRETTKAANEALAMDAPVSANLSTVFLSPLQGVDYGKKLAQNFANAYRGSDDWRPMNTDDMTVTNYVQDIRGATGDYIEENTRWTIGDQNVARFLYDTGMSIGDSTVAIAALGPAASVLLGGSAASTTTKTVLDNGGTADQAILSGAAAGFAEAFFEKFSVDRLLSIKDVNSVKSLLTSVGKQMLTEGSEEGATEIANILANAIIMGDSSDFNVAVDYYKSTGMTEEEAKKQALMDSIGQVAWAVAGGVISGGVMGGVSSSAQLGGNVQAARAKYGADPNALVEETLANDPGNKYAKNVQEELAKGGRATGLQLSTLEGMNTDAVMAQDKSKIAQGAAARLTELGEQGDTAYLGKAIAKVVAGERLSPREQYNLWGNERAEQVMRELMPIAIRAGANESEWSQRLGTKRINADVYGQMVRADEAAQQSVSRMTAEAQEQATVNPNEMGSAAAVIEQMQREDEALTDDDYAMMDLFEDIPQMDDTAKLAAIAGQKASGISAQEYTSGAREAYQYGLEGRSIRSMDFGESTRRLSRAQAQMFHEMGSKAAGKTVAEQQTAREQYRKDMKAAEGRKGKVNFEGNTRSLTKRQKESMKTMNVLADTMGVTFHVFESYKKDDGERYWVDPVTGEETKAPNGMYRPETGEIYIDLHAGADGSGLMLYTVSHELTHFIAQWSPAKFRVLAEFLMEEFSTVRDGRVQDIDVMIQLQIDKAKRAGRDISRKEAYEEMVADAMEAMLVDTDVVAKLTKLKARDESLWNKIKGFITRLAKRVRAAYEGLEPDSAEGRFVQQMVDDISRLEDAFAEALYDASGNYVGAAESVVREGQPMHSERGKAPTFYSHMARVIDGVKQQKLGAASVIPMLRGKGVKQEEIKWSGIEQFLEGKKSVTKQELQEFAAGSMLEIEEEVLDDRELPFSEEQSRRIAELEAEHDDIMEDLSNEWKRITGEPYPHARAGEVGLKIADYNTSSKRRTRVGRLEQELRRDVLEKIDWYGYFGFDNAREALYYFQSDTDSFIANSDFDNDSDRQLFVDYANAFKGIDAQPDVITTADSNRLISMAEDAEKRQREIRKIHEEHVNENNKVRTRWKSYKLKGGKNYRELLFKLPDSSYSNGAMWSHWDGRKGVLAHARVQDFNTPDGKMLFVEEIQSDWHNEGHKQGYVDNSETEKLIRQIRNLREELGEILTDWDDPNRVQKANALRDEIHRLDAKINDKGLNKDSVPDAPFRNNYTDFVMKRLIREAAENGYDSIGWTTADIQSERWSDEYAEGYRIEYDQDIRKFMRKFGDKWGAKVGKTELDEGTEVWSMPITDSMRESVLYEGQPMYSERGRADADYMAAVERGDMATAQRMVDAAAKAAGYEHRMFHETNAKNIHVFDISRNTHGGTDYETPYGIFTKSRANNIGLGSRQMALFVKAQNTLNVENREDVRKKIPGFEEYYNQIKEIDRKYDALCEELEDEELDALQEWMEENPDADMDAVYPTSYIVEDKPADIDSERYLEAHQKYRETRAEWSKAYDAVAVKAKEFLTDYLRSNGYDSMYFKVDAGSFGRQTDSLIVLDNNQVKSADPVTYDDNGNVIPLSKRFNPENEDIRYSERGGEVTNRQMLANAFEGIAKNDAERQKMQEYQQKVATMDELERHLQELNSEIRNIKRGKSERPHSDIEALQTEVEKTVNRIDITDRQLLRLEAAAPLQAVLTREREKATRKAKEQGKAAVKRVRESAAEAEEKRKIRRKIAALRKLFDRGNKDKNVKDGLRETVDAALRAADVLFMTHLSAEEMIRNGITTTLTEREQAYVAKAETYLKQRDALVGDNYDKAKWDEADRKLRGQLGQLGEVFERQRMEMSQTKVRKVLQDLMDAYAKTKDSAEDYIRGAYDSNLYDELAVIREWFDEGTTVRDMTLEQLKEVNKAYTMVLTVVRKANDLFAKNIKGTLREIATKVMDELGSQKPKGDQAKALQAVRKFAWDNLKPIYAFMRIGSDTLTDLYENIRKGEDVWAVDMNHARKFRRRMARQYGAKKWDMERTFTFHSAEGTEFQLDLGQLMSIYAYSRREQALEHLRVGGIVIDAEAVTKHKNKAGITVEYLKDDATAYNITDTELMEMVKALRSVDPNILLYVEEMQDYLSTTMGAKGNEVSMQLYGVRQFTEENYFPLRSASQYLAAARDQKGAQVKLKNSGFTKVTKPNANNPVVLGGFDAVWADHVNDMSMYHAFTLPLEDFYKVYNFKTQNTDDSDLQSIDAMLQNIHGSGATAYIDRLLKDINADVVSDNRESLGKSLVSKFKKAAVFTSMSVVVQQYSAVGRAFALIDPKYFGSIKGITDRKNTLREMRKYAPVTIIKQMGYFDTNMGMSAREFLLEEDYEGFLENAKAMVTDAQHRDEMLGRLPAMADEQTWGTIWEAVKREVAAKNPTMTPNSEEHLIAAGERFTEVITKTQVYDSVFSRSANMRSKSLFMGMITSFMAEPTTSINMMQEAIREFKAGDKRSARKMAGAVVTSVVLNSLLASIVYALRDDDEDETFLEKYISSVATEIVDGLNPMTYVPILRDIWSYAQGYDIERADMSLIADFIDNLNYVQTVLSKDTSDMSEEELAEYDKERVEAILRLLETTAAFGGLSIKNIRRDWKMIGNAINMARSDNDTTLSTFTDALVEGAVDALPQLLRPDGKTKKEELLSAYLQGDKEKQKRLNASYDSEEKALSALKSAAGSAFKDGKLSKKAALKLLKENIGMTDSEAQETILQWQCKVDTGIDYNNLKDAYLDGELTAAEAINLRMKYGGQSRKEAEKTVTEWSCELATGIAYGEVKEAFIEGEMTENEAVNIRMTYGGYTQMEAEDTVASWSFEKEHGYAYSDRADLFIEGEITERELREILRDYGECTEVEINNYIKAYTWMKNNPKYNLSVSNALNYTKAVETLGVSAEQANINPDVFVEYIELRSTCKGEDADGDGRADTNTKKNQILAVIDNLPISNYQKDVLYFQNGWARSTLRKAPWH